MKKIFVSILVCAAIISGGATLVIASVAYRGSRSEAVEKPVASIPNVKVQVLKPSLFEDSLVLTGTAQPWEDITLSAEVVGKIEWQGVEEGDSVKAGQELFKIDTATLQAAVDQAAAQHKLTLQEFERQERLAKGGMSTAQARDRTLADRDVTAANLRVAQIRLQKSVVKSPFDCVVDKIYKKQAEFVDSGMPLVRLVQINKIKVIVGIPERDSGFFKIGDAVKISLDALPDKTFAGRVARIGTTAEASTHTFTAEIEVENAAGELKPGMVARATLVRKSYPDAIVAPIFSVLTVDDKRFVFTEDQGLAHLRSVQVGILQGSNVQVTQGLAPGDRLIVVGQRDARDNEPVQVQEIIE